MLEKHFISSTFSLVVVDMDKSCLALPQITHCKIPRGINMAAQVTTEGGTSRDRQREREGAGQAQKNPETQFISVFASQHAVAQFE